MTMRLRFTPLLLALALAALPVRAAVNPCDEAPDDTPCSSGCSIAGRCLGGTCMGGSSVSDGTRCATGDPCSANDTCAAGVCVAGPIFTQCPTRCGETPTCRRDVGCVYTVNCDPDAGLPDAGPADAGDPDAGGPDAGDIDGGVVDAGDGDGGPLDAGESDGGSSLVFLDGGPIVDGERAWTDLQGSGCGAATLPVAGATLALALLLRRRR